MACTTLLVGKNASWNGSTMIARNDDSGSGKFTAKKFTVVEPEDQPREYESVISHLHITLPDDPVRYTAMPNALKGEGIWAACGINQYGVAMTATETITSNPRVLGADPLVEYQKKWESDNLYFGTDSVVEEEGEDQEKAGGIGEEDLVVITLPYIHSAREGVRRLGELHQTYGTYEENGIAISDKDEIWWFESVGGHHWIARRVDDDGVVVMPNQLGIDSLDIDDALGEQVSNMCSQDLLSFIDKNHLDLENHYDDDEFDSDMEDDESSDHYVINPRIVFGSHDDADHVYNTPRAWYMLRYLEGKDMYEGDEAIYGPEDDDLPWQVFPSVRLAPEDVKYLLSSHYQGTRYDPYLSYGDKSSAGAYRSIGINRNDFLGFAELRSGAEPIEWVAFGSNAFNAMAPFYTNVSRIPDYLSNTTGRVSTDNFYWTSRLIAALSDASYGKCQNVIEIYNEKVMSKAHAIINRFDERLAETRDTDRQAICEEANDQIADMLKDEADKALAKALYFRSNDMKNQYARSDH